MRQPFLLLPALLLGACSLISPYTITFTNTPDSVIDPSSSTLDFVVSSPTLAYVSGVSCEGADPLEILPVANKDMDVATVHKLPLTLMKDQAAGAKCEVTVTAYDKTTTETSSASIELVMNGIPLAKEGEMCGGIAAIQCAEGLSCDMPEDSTVSDASGTCVSSDSLTAPIENSPVDNSTETTSDSTDTTRPTDASADSSAPTEPVGTDASSTSTSVDTTTPTDATPATDVSNSSSTGS